MFKNTFIATKLKVSAIITVIGLALLVILSYDKISNLQNDFKKYNSIKIQTTNLKSVLVGGLLTTSAR